MSVKMIALAAAVALSGSVASADSYFELGQALDSSSILDLGLVRSDSTGVVEVYDSLRGEPGRLLGTKTVHMGANPDVRVNIGATPLHDVIAVLKIDGEIVAQRDYEIDR